ncbi:MAG: alpha-glucan family phosphorylase [Elusimicrobia bacterium]|nr:alpha-glucan family phosphorylase [Elusimicrobiota bacterium]
MNSTKTKSLLPERIARLSDVAYNFWWSWHHEARDLFKEMDRSLWTNTQHSPVPMLHQLPPARLQQLAADPAFLARYDKLVKDLDHYLERWDTWFGRNHPHFKGHIAYFSAEFGLHNSLRIYSGGLGILAGDHCKSASDLGVPLIGVGFMYPKGYVQQRIGPDGWQQNVYEHAHWETSPVGPVLDEGGKPLLLKVPLGSSQVLVAVWQVLAGRVKLYLMDTHVEGNSKEDQEISDRLYGGDRTKRLRQEIVLGICGVRMLRALNIPVSVYHANEGHASFLYLELIRELVAAGKPFRDAAREVAEASVFTTHTPVPAGHDVFPEETIAEYFKDYWPELGLDRERFLALGRIAGQPGWNMTALAMRLSCRRNGVSRRHGQVSRRMWAQMWENEGRSEVPIGYITNGVHLDTWVHRELCKTLDQYLGEGWRERQDDPSLWAKVSSIPDAELWSVHQRNKAEFFRFLRRRLRKRWMDGHTEASQVVGQGAMLDPDALTIGFARRFAAYKRATLLLRDIDRLKAMLLDPWRPVQFVFAGKSHPDDDLGKGFIQQIYRLARDPAFGGRIAFVEDYDMHLARYLVYGVDLWLNNPQPPLEACGTSGIKAAVNGIPNLSIADGWWVEGFNGMNGWSIGSAETEVGAPPTDESDAAALYETIERQVVPLFYDRSGGVPLGWVKMMKESIRSVSPRFCSNRMVKEYVDRCYLPAETAFNSHQAAPAPAPEPYVVPSWGGSSTGSARG